jgi:hypothetical protein
MKRFFGIVVLLFVHLGVNGQAFEVVDTNVMVRNNQSPVHWYGEVKNLVGADTTLHWKVEFDNVPAEWVINFDDQYQFYDTLQHGDSADFVLFTGQTLPQKLIIGITLNDVYGKQAVITFRLSDPADLSVKSVIHFRIDVPPYTVGIEEQEQPLPFTRHNGQLIFHEKVEEIRWYDLSGRMVAVVASILPGDVLSVPLVSPNLGVVQWVSKGHIHARKFHYMR